MSLLFLFFFRSFVLSFSINIAKLVFLFLPACVILLSHSTFFFGVNIFFLLLLAPMLLAIQTTFLFLKSLVLFIFCFYFFFSTKYVKEFKEYSGQTSLYFDLTRLNVIVVNISNWFYFFLIKHTIRKNLLRIKIVEASPVNGGSNKEQRFLWLLAENISTTEAKTKTHIRHFIFCIIHVNKLIMYKPNSFEFLGTS